MVKCFWPCSNMQICKVKNHLWTWSKKFEFVQKILNTVKTIWAWMKYFWASRWNRHVSLLSFLLLFFVSAYIIFKLSYWIRRRICRLTYRDLHDYVVISPEVEQNWLVKTQQLFIYLNSNLVSVQKTVKWGHGSLDTP